jgi:hypothetical protein
MKALRVIYEVKGKYSGVYIGQPCEIAVPGEIVLGYSLGPLTGSIKRYQVGANIIEGCAVAEDSEKLQEFEEKYQIDLVESDLGRRGTSWRRHHKGMVTITLGPSFENPKLFAHRAGGNTYLFRGDVEMFLIYKWFEERGAITATLCGRYQDRFFYYSGGGRQSKTLKFCARVPDTLQSRFGTNYGYWEFHGYDSDFPAIREGRTSTWVDPLPFPPYEVVGALTLLPPEKVVNMPPGTLPETFRDIYLLRSLLVLEDPVPVMTLSPQQLRALADHVNGDIFDPNTVAGYPKSEYEALWKSCDRYVLVCKPKWPL